MTYSCEKRFQWDPVKNQANVKKHSLSFEEATGVFRIHEDFILEEFDFFHSIYEDRINTIGPINRGVIVVVSTEKDDVIRIVSARFASSKEKKLYAEMIARMKDD